MRRCKNPRFLFVAVFLVAICLASGDAGAQPARTGPVQGEIDPFSITLYADYNYQKPIGTWTLAPGMRMLKVQELHARPLSAVLGEKVTAVIFPNSHFASDLRAVTETIKNPLGGVETPVKTYLVPHWRVKGSSNRIDPKYFPSIPCSFILHRKDIGDFLGVYLESGPPVRRGQFLPLPERARDTVIVYHKVVFELNKAPLDPPLSLRLEPGGTGVMSLYPSLSPPNPNDIVVTITTPEGATVKLPEVNSQTAQFDLNKYGVQRISSLKIEYKGPITEQAYLPVQAVRAPAAPNVAQTPPPVGTRAPGASGIPGQPMVTKDLDVSGQWKNDYGQVYQIVQTGDRFEWTSQGGKEKAVGTIDGKNLAVSWKGPQGVGSALGTIMKADSEGRAVEIQWNNGARFMR